MSDVEEAKVNGVGDHIEENGEKIEKTVPISEENGVEADQELTVKRLKDNVVVAEPVVPNELTEAVAKANTAKAKFSVLKTLTESVEISDRDLVDTLFNLLVGGEFDLEINYIIKDYECILHMVDLLNSCSIQCQAEVWSKFKGICRKSTRNLQACTEAKLLSKLLHILQTSDDIISELLIDMLGLLASYSITVKELKLFLSMLRCENGRWPLRAVKLLQILEQIPERHGPDCFFMFPGVRDAAIALPPLKAWPQANGWTFSTWFRMDPLNNMRIDIDKPYLYCFRNSKGLGYSGHFVGNYLVVTILKAKGKGFQHCLKYEFKPGKWYMVSIVHIYNRWRTSELKCYANGQLVSYGDMNWSIGANEPMDKCFLGSAESGDETRVFCGQMSAAYVFSEALNPSQIYAIYQLGPDYKNQFKFSGESDKLLANHHRKVLHDDSKLYYSVIISYNPKATDGQLCLESSPRTPATREGNAHRWFVHSPHALMLSGVSAVVTHSIHCALHSVGGIDVLYSLFSQLNQKQQDGSTDTTVCLTLLKFVLHLMQGSVKTQLQILRGKGFLVIGNCLEKASSDHITMDVLNVLLDISKYLDTQSHSLPLLRQFCDHVFFNPALWIHTDPKVQLALYTHLATEFISSTAMQTTIRRVSTVLLLIHSLKHYYWVVNPQDRSGIIPKALDGPRPNKDEMLSLRAFILLFLKQLVTRSGVMDDELQAIISYLITMHEDENVLDVLQLLVALMSEHSHNVAPVFDSHNGVSVVFKLLASQSEAVRVHAIKLLGFFLVRCHEKRKEELMTNHSLFALVGERLLAHADSSDDAAISVTTYNVMYELLIGEPSSQVLDKPHPPPSETTKIQNPMMLKVIGNLIRQWPHDSDSLMDVRLMFLNDMIGLFKNSRENRRTLLQQSVWQDWMLSLTYIKPTTRQEKMCQEHVYALFKILLYHAVKLEWGGWRVWVDTLAIVHSKVSFESHKQYLENMYKEYKRAESNAQQNGQISTITGATGSHPNKEERVETDDSKEWVTESETEVSQKSEESDNEDSVKEDDRIEEISEDNQNKKEDQEVEEKLQDVVEESHREPVVMVDMTNEVEETPEDVAEKEPLENKDDDHLEAKTQEVEETPEDVAEQDPSENKDEPLETPEDDEEEAAKDSSSESASSHKSEAEEDRKSHSSSSSDSSHKSKDSSDGDVATEQKDNQKDVAEENEKDVAEHVSEEVLHEGDEEATDKAPSKMEGKSQDAVADEEVQLDDKSEGQENTEEMEEQPQTDDIAQKEESNEQEEKADEENEEEDKIKSTDSSAESKDEVKQDQTTKEEVQKVDEDVVDSSVSAQNDEAVATTSKPLSNMTSGNKTAQFSPGPRTGVFRIPEFKWSKFHLRLFNDLFVTLEEEVAMWKSIPRPLANIVNSNDNLIFVHNSLHLISQMIDNIILACGGILPILSSATSPNYDLDSVDSSQGLSMETSWKILNRLASLMDILAFTTTLSFSEIEQEKNMSAGGILRQCLRTACICSVRNCLENRYNPPDKPSNGISSSRVVGGSFSSAEGTSVALHVVSSGDESTEEEDERLSVVDAARMLLSQMSNSATEITDHLRLLQEADVTRLKSTVYRDMDDTKQAQFLALAVVYFVSVLMVSKYRDVLDPDSYSKLLEATVSKKVLPKEIPVEEEDDISFGSTEVEEEKKNEPIKPSSKDENEQANSNTVQEILKNLAKSPSTEYEKSGMATQQNDQVPSIQSQFQSFDRSVSVTKQTEPVQSVTSVSMPEATVPETNETTTADAEMEAAPTTEATTSSNVVLTNGSSDPSVLPQINTLEDVINQKNGSENISARLERALKDLEPLLRDIFVDFSGYLSKALVGSHGQELLNEGLVCMKSNNSVVELVMLLCSQEWQNSIQKNAGLAFIELINEGRLLCHAMKEHVVRVANEADFILNKQRAEDVKKHSEFEANCAVHMSQQRMDERQCDMLISAAKHRDQAAAVALCNRITNIMTNKHGAWGAAFIRKAREYWKLDAWEDDTRRRRRFVKNPYGSSHPDATLKVLKEEAPAANEDVTDAAVAGKYPSSGTATAVTTTPQVSEDQQSVSSDEEDQMQVKSEPGDQTDINGPVTFTTECSLIAPGVCVQGTFSITSEDIFYEVIENHESFKQINQKVLHYTDSIHGKWSFHEVRAVFSRRYLLQTTAVEIFMANRTSVMFNFPDNAIMKKVINLLPKVGIGTGYGLPQTKRISLAGPRQLLKSSNMTQRWQQREISNFEYLMFLNTIAGRTYNDLNQYPVFPWVLTNYESPELDLSLPSNYRDLSKPIGALNPKRQTYFQNRYDNWDDPNIPKFHYGTHYSNAAFTLNWLIRVEPFTSLFLSLQGGKFDHADRTFSSVLQSWKNCQRDSHDVKELIPEFFYLPEMFANNNSYNLGATSEGQSIGNIKLPPWAKSADDFVRLHRMALESEIVSCQLHQWIDLIFGYKQRGTEAIRATNVFYYLTYENAVKLDEIIDPIERQGLKDQIKNFGQTPSQLLVDTHPPRSSAMHVTPMMFKEAPPQDVIMVLKFLSNSPVTHVAANTHPSLPSPSIVTCTSNLQFCVNKWNQINTNKNQSTAATKTEDNPQQLPIEPDPLMNSNMGKRQISDMLDQSVKVQSSCFVVTADNKHLMSCGYWDRSIRIINTDTGKLTQVIFSHWDVVTCLVRSETYIGGDCYIVSGSRDATLLLWYWNGRKSKILGDTTSPNENPSPRAVLTGHDSEIVAVAVCAELGLIASASLDGPVLLHTITGDLLHTLELPKTMLEGAKLDSLKPELLTFSSEGVVFVCYSGGILCNFTMNGRFLFTTTIDDVVKAIAVSSDGQYILTGGNKGILQVWSSWDFKSLYTFPQCDAGIRHLDISHDQKTVITGMSSGSIVAFYIDFNKWHYEYKDKY